ncbi:hypothetical protein RSAG8_11752, partial [Rhizoctonia solani AG-8 WAC10335]
MGLMDVRTEGGGRVISHNFGGDQEGVYTRWEGWRDALGDLDPGARVLEGGVRDDGEDANANGRGAVGEYEDEMEVELDTVEEIVAEVEVGDMVRCPHCDQEFVVVD